MIKDKTNSNLSFLVVMPTYPPAHSGGGIRIHRQYLRLRDRLNLSVRVLSAEGRGLSAGCAVQDGISVFRIKNRGSFRMFFRMGRFLIMNRPAVIHSAGDTSFNYAASIWAWCLRIPLIKERTMNSDFFRQKGRRILFRFVHRYAVLCIALNRSIADQFLRVGVDENRVFCRPNPVDCKIFHKPSAREKECAREKFGTPSGVCLHLVVGRFCARKNQIQAVEALSRLSPEHHLLLVGPVLDSTDEQYVREIRAVIECRGPDARVRLLTEHMNVVSDLYWAVDCLWIPSLTEGTPNVMLEALCSGIPVLPNRDLGLQDFVEDGVNGWNVDFSGEDLQHVLELLFEGLDSDGIANKAAREYAAEQIDSLYIDRLYQAGLIKETKADG